MNTRRKIGFFKTGFLVLTALLIHSVKAQELFYKNERVGFNIGGNFAFGTHVHRIGLNLNFFCVNNFVQANTELRMYFNFRNLGPRIPHPELVLSQGIVFGYGYWKNIHNPFINSVSNQTGYPYSLGYSYNAYFNKIKTTQQTGIVSLQFNSVSVILENDILARPLLDRFRTGAFLVQYQHEDVMQVGINCSMWTGRMGKSVQSDTCFPAIGYMDTTGGVYTNYSHGLLSAQVKYNMGLSQIAQVNVGIDSEKVRNAVQNKFIHDVCWLPKKWFKRYNCHIPMLDEKCGQYLYRGDQKIKKAAPYWNVFSNPNLFY